MKYFGSVKSFDAIKGLGELTPETGGDPLRFERSAFLWNDNSDPKIGQRLSYDVGTNSERERRATNLQTI